MKTAIFIDGSYFIRRLNYLYKNKKDFNLKDSKQIVSELSKICYRHLNIQNKQGEIVEKHDLYRIFFYDCPPLTKKVHLPISQKAYDFAKTADAILREQIFENLRKNRKTALRLGRLQDFGSWKLKPDVLKEILSKAKDFSQLTDEDFTYEIRQKSVDMKIGIDIASVAYKKQVERIILIAGDADFVPAAKLARREGIDFILDPMWNNISPDLFEHIDGLSSTCFRTKDSSSKE